MNDTVIVVTGAAPLDAGVVAALPEPAIVIAVDGALDHALTAGLTPAALIGDLDSISATGLEWAEANCTIDRHSTDKNQTDTELALAMAADLNPAQLILLAGGGDRLDHTMGAIGALGHSSLTSVPSIGGWWGDQCFVVLHGPGKTTIEPGSAKTLSLLATHGPCAGVTVDGVRWPLEDADLEPMVGLGISNEPTGDEVHVALRAGVLTIFINAPEGTPTK